MAISKELSKEIDIITREVSEPAIEAMMSQIRDYLKVVSQKPYAIKENQEEVINESREILAQWVTGEDERHLVEEGFGLVCQETSRSSEGKNLLEEFKQVGMRIQERISKTHLDESEKEVNVFNTIQESLGISNKSIDTIYKIGNDFMHNKEIHKGLAVFSFLTFLNVFIFEGWLMLGVAYREDGQFFKAMYAFSMASLLNLQHPFPHLCSAEIYHMNGNQELAKQTLEYALSLISKEDLQMYKPMIESVEQMIS